MFGCRWLVAVRVQARANHPTRRSCVRVASHFAFAGVTASMSWGGSQRPGGGGQRTYNDLSRRVPKNARYNDIKSRIDSGSTVHKVKLVSTRNVVKRANETFFRIRADELYELLSEYETRDADEDILVNKVSGMDFNPRIVTYEADSVQEYDRPYLILDVRTEQEFHENHILQARNFPQRLLLQDKATAELVKYRNRDNCLIVLYDNQHDRLAAAAAQVLGARGFDNIYVLHGGICRFAEAFPSYVEGDSSILLENMPPNDARDGLHTARSRLTSSSSNCSALSHRSNSSRRSQISSSSRHSQSSMRSNRHAMAARNRRSDFQDAIDEIDSNASRASVAESVISQAMSRKHYSRSHR